MNQYCGDKRKFSYRAAQDTAEVLPIANLGDCRLVIGDCRFVIADWRYTERFA